MVAAAIALASGCVTQEVDETLPPYAAISDQAGVPPKPPPSDDSGGFFSAVGSAIAYPFRLVGDAFESN
jgi:hypothetical protein